MKILINQIAVSSAKLEQNKNTILQIVADAKQQSYKLLVFPELTLTGNLFLNLCEFDSFKEDVNNALNEIINAADNIALIIGAYDAVSKKNTLYFIENKTIKYKTCKQNISFNELGFTFSGENNNVFEFCNQKVYISFMDDIKDIGCYGQDINIITSVQAFDYTIPEKNHTTLSSLAKKTHATTIFCNAVGGSAQIVMHGNSSIYNKEGELISQANSFTSDSLSIDLSKEYQPIEFEKKEKIELIHKGLITGLRNYFKSNGFSKAVLGLSGGIDSALVVALATEALGKDNVCGILLPSQYSTSHSVDDAVQSAKNLQISYEIIAIKDIYQTIETSLSPIFKNLPFNVTEENIQARIRGLLLMAYSNKFGNILLNTSNKSEAAVGYGTLYGDLSGSMSILGDIYKTEVYELSKWINRNNEIIPLNSITKEPSAELRPNQKDQDSLPPYDILDKILHFYIEERKSKQAIINLGFDATIVERITKLLHNSEFKRRQVPFPIKVSPATFGVDFKLPIS